MVNASKRLPDNLGPLEQRVMEILWSRGPANAEQVREALGPKRRLKDSTIRTILRRLHEKGYARYKVEGRTYFYTAAEQPRNVAVRAVRRIIDRFCKGSVEELLTGMVDSEVLSRAELRELAAKIAGRKSRKGES
ncbi:MAG TPA: BlaI/MecI/CopY family transcriptional regulator [Bryobacteraceae bacterium]